MHELSGQWSHTGVGREWEHRNPAVDVDFVLKWEDPYTVDVFIARPFRPTSTGDGHPDKDAIRDFVQTAIPVDNRQNHPPGLCVTVDLAEFIHKDGTDYGYRIGLRNYPRFPKTKTQIMDLAIRLAEYLIEKLEQNTALIDAPDATVWVRSKVKLEDEK